VKHRHLDLSGETRVAKWPSAAIVDVLERGDLEAWRPIAAEIARDPHGPLADRVMRLVDAYPMYGTSPLWRAWIDRRRACGRHEGPAPAAMDLATLRRDLDLTQVELAGRLGMSQSDLSKLERRRDVRLSTLRAFAEALGGRLRVVYAAAHREIELEIG